MDLNSILAIIAAISSLMTLFCTQLRKMRVKEVDVCDGHCLKVISSPRSSGENSKHIVNEHQAIIVGGDGPEPTQVDRKTNK